MFNKTFLFFYIQRYNPTYRLDPSVSSNLTGQPGLNIRNCLTCIIWYDTMCICNTKYCKIQANEKTNVTQNRRFGYRNRHFRMRERLGTIGEQKSKNSTGYQR